MCLVFAIKSWSVLQYDHQQKMAQKAHRQSILASDKKVTQPEESNSNNFISNTADA